MSISQSQSAGRRVIVTTTPTIEGQHVTEYLGIVSGEAILGANILKDITAAFRDIAGGRSTRYEEELRKAKQIAVQEMTEMAQAMGADAILSVDLDYETIGSGGSMLMVSASGTAVKLG
ncbi:MAG: heavy metal-binding domain-containing protein [Chloroflexi bacterium]|nr:heavy metal-binding domain-containing protein [Chloroflexota bacterium]